MDNRDVVMGGFNSDDGTVRRVRVDQSGFLTANLVLQGTGVFSINPFDEQFDVDDGILDMLPVVNFQYMAGPNTGTGNTAIFGRVKYFNVEFGADPTASLQTAEIAGGGGVTDAPAANTAAVVQIGGQGVRVNGFGFTINAVAAIVVPVLVQLVEDVGGANIVRWSGRYTAAAGTTIKEWIETPYLCLTDATLTVAAPGATNFATASMNGNVTGNAPA